MLSGTHNAAQGRYRGRVIPLAFALMTRRRKAAYRAVLEALDQKHIALSGRALSPTFIITDFEVRLSNKC
jgi:hypothetical protein